MASSADVARTGMPFEELDAGSTAADTAQLAAGLRVPHLLVGHGAEVLADPQATGVAGGAESGQHMVGPDHLVAVGDAGVLAQKQCAVVMQFLQRLAWLGGDDLDVL